VVELRRNVFTTTSQKDINGTLINLINIAHGRIKKHIKYNIFLKIKYNIWEKATNTYRKNLVCQIKSGYECLTNRPSLTFFKA